MDEIKDMRKAYERGVLYKKDVDPDPAAQFEKWFKEATAVCPNEANAMTISTLGADGMPSGRTVLLKEMDERGFVFYTNYNSRKGKEIAQHPKVSLLFWWRELERQVRINGIAEKIDRVTTQAYFDTRPFGSRMGAIASPQSQVVPDRAYISKLFDEADVKYHGTERPAAPEHWGGFRVIPSYFEFWQGRPNRLHDRIQYSPTETGWLIERLAP